MIIIKMKSLKCQITEITYRKNCKLKLAAIKQDLATEYFKKTFKKIYMTFQTKPKNSA